MHDYFKNQFETVIVGARCAGAATALHLARGGQRVLLIDRDQPGTDTLSTHALMRLGVSLLDQAGVLPEIILAGTPAVRRTVFNYGGDRLPVEIAPSGRAKGLYAPRRMVLDGLLVDAARAAGATVAFGTELDAVVHGAAGRIVGVVLRGPDGTKRPLRCDRVVGADGRQSAVAKAANAAVHRQGANMTACVYTYVDAPQAAEYEWLFGPQAMAGLIPTNDGKACAFACVQPGVLRQTFAGDPYRALREIFARCGANPSLLPDAPAERLRRFVGAPGHMRQAWGPGWALVGDAGYFKDPATAHGLTDALRDARLLADAMLTGTETALEDYQTIRDDLSVDFFETTDRIASLDWSLDEVKALHLRLHALMRAEQDAILGRAQALVA